MDLKDGVVIITGASDGIGREAALRLAREGVKLALVSKNEEKLAKVAEEIRVSGNGQVNYYTCDVRDNASVEKAVNQIAADFGSISVLINIAGIWQKLNYVEDIPPQELADVINVNLVGLMLMTRAALPHLRQQGSGAIINFASRSGVTAQPGQSAYCASKWGVRGFTEVLKEDLAGSKIRVAAIYPAGIKTELLDKAGDSINTDDYSDPKDIAEVIAFMLTRPDKLWLHEVRITY